MNKFREISRNLFMFQLQVRERVLLGAAQTECSDAKLVRERAGEQQGGAQGGLLLKRNDGAQVKLTLDAMDATNCRLGRTLEALLVHWKGLRDQV